MFKKVARKLISYKQCNNLNLILKQCNSSAVNLLIFGKAVTVWHAEKEEKVLFNSANKVQISEMSCLRDLFQLRNES